MTEEQFDPENLVKLDQVQLEQLCNQCLLKL